jgi:glycosyltransferase involved in cell wall biosynthesis
MNNNVSVIIPTNASRISIFNSIDSVRNQIYNHKIEIIVVVNGNKFNEEILSKLKSVKDIKLLNSPKSNGNAARHLGVESSAFEILCFLDDDDLWVPNKLSYQVSKMIKVHTEIIILFQNQKVQIFI